MTDFTYPSYEAATQAYRDAFTALLVEAPGMPATVTRGAGNVPAEQLISQADTIATISAQMVVTGRTYRTADDLATRSGITAHFLTQAAAETQLAIELLELAQEVQTGQSSTSTTRSTRTTALRSAITSLEEVLAAPVTSGLMVSQQKTRTTTITTVEAASKELREVVDVATATIIVRVVDLGTDLAYNLVISTDWNEVRSAAALFRSDVAVQLDKVKAEAGQLVVRAATVAQKTLLNVFDKILAILGQDAEHAARTTIQEWLDKLAKDKKIAGLEDLIGALYQVEPFKLSLAARLEQSVELNVLNSTTTAVDNVQRQFITLAGYAENLATALSLLRKTVQWYPPILPIAASFQIALMSTLVYAGWDFIGYGQVKFLSINEGIAEVIQKQLGVI